MSDGRYHNQLQLLRNFRHAGFWCLLLATTSVVYSLLKHVQFSHYTDVKYCSKPQIDLTVKRPSVIHLQNASALLSRERACSLTFNIP